MKQDQARRLAGKLVSEKLELAKLHAFQGSSQDADKVADDIVEAIAAALVKLTQGQEVVAYGMRDRDGAIYDCIAPDEHAKHEGDYTVPLYTRPAPSQQEDRKPLTEHEGWAIAKSICGVVYSDVLRMDERLVTYFVRAIEAAHGIKEQQ